MGGGRDREVLLEKDNIDDNKGQDDKNPSVV